jgi:hypothetical protein
LIWKWVGNNAEQSLAFRSSVSACMLLCLCGPCYRLRACDHKFSFSFRWMHMMVSQHMFVDSVWIKLMYPIILKSNVKSLMLLSGNYWEITNHVPNLVRYLT